MKGELTQLSDYRWQYKTRGKTYYVSHRWGDWFVEGPGDRDPKKLSADSLDEAIEAIDYPMSKVYSQPCPVLQQWGGTPPTNPAPGTCAHCGTVPGNMHSPTCPALTGLSLQCRQCGCISVNLLKCPHCGGTP